LCAAESAEAANQSEGGNYSADGIIANETNVL